MHALMIEWFQGGQITYLKFLKQVIDKQWSTKVSSVDLYLLGVVKAFTVLFYIYNGYLIIEVIHL